MINALYLLISLTPSTQSQVLFDRYEQFVAASKNLHVEMTVDVRNAGTASAILWLRRGESIRFAGRWRDEDYTFALHKGSVLELQRNQKVYDEYHGVRGLAAPPSKLSRIPGLVFPGFLLSSDIRTSFARGQQFTDEGMLPYKGRNVASISTIVTDPDGQQQKLRFRLEQTGVPVSFEINDFNGTKEFPAQVWHFNKVSAPGSIDEELFALRIPDGFVPYRLPDSFGPINAGNPFPASDWTRASGGKGNLPLSKGVLVAYLGEDCRPSREAAESLGRLERNGIRVVRVGTMNGVQFTDPDGSKAEALAIPATPSFFMVDGGSKITNLWMGFDASKARQFEASVRTAASEQK